MHNYDVALKNVLTRGSVAFLSRLMGLEVAKFLPSELPQVRNLRADLLGEARDGTLFQIELQSNNQSDMAFRMLDYLVAIRQRLGRIPKQLILYVGKAPMRMENKIAVAALSYECALLDIRSVDGSALLESDSLNENIVSILARQPDKKTAARRILKRIAASRPERRAKALRELTMLAGLRSLEDFVKEEVNRMPILADIMDHKVFGPLIRKGRAEGRAEGEIRERALLLKQLTQRFGTVPLWVSERIEKLEIEEVEDICVRLLDAQSLKELFGTDKVRRRKEK